MKSSLAKEVFRSAARRVGPDVHVNQWADVQLTLDGGAFVEARVWVSAEAAQAETERRDDEEGTRTGDAAR